MSSSPDGLAQSHAAPPSPTLEPAAPPPPASQGGSAIRAGLDPAAWPAAWPQALGRLLALQRPDGCWEGEMVWNTMILSQYVIVREVVGRPLRLDEPSRTAAIRHYQVSQRADGSFGMHPESGGYVFFTTLAYVALRLLGVEAAEPLTARARAWLMAQPGGVLSIPTWGKYWLAFIGLHEWSGVNPISPELFLLPSATPIHPDRYYCHTRNSYAGLAALYGLRFRADLGPITASLREELYPEGCGGPYQRIDFAAHRHQVARSDLFVAPGRGVRLAQEVLRALDGLLAATLRPRALAHCLERIVYEQRQSRYQAISPVNGLLDCLVLHAVDPAHPDLAPSLEGVEAWRWQDEAEGLRYCGARSNTWDTAFALQAVLAAPRLPEAALAAARRGYRYLLGAQMTEELPDRARARREPALGGWCFSDGQHRWPVSDCTAEALSAIVACHHRPGLLAPSERIDERRLRLAATFILQRQNDDGGFGTYERRRGAGLLERINATEMYGQCMTERSYLECTAAAVTALSELGESHPAALPAGASAAIERAVRFLLAAQRADGSFPGFWGINFTYAAFHVLRALRRAGHPPSHPVLRRAASFLCAHQRADGGWGEHFRSCLEDRYVEHPRSQPAMTSWAVLALLESRPGAADPTAGAHGRAIERGLEWLSRYLADPAPAPEAVNGVFFGSAMLDYRYYKHYFPLWALSAAGRDQTYSRA